MRAILRTKFGGPEVPVIREMPEPEPKDGHAVIQVKALSLNNTELHIWFKGSLPDHPDTVRCCPLTSQPKPRRFHDSDDEGRPPDGQDS
jgi:hypothetical protein